ncbi:keratin-associated protein 5-5 isoform X1 [Alligator mississippiensis]|uniref:keratin-associated protein 5-5 isoform X1 n=1 Tax=Alligator mississippiensis TaxID=8496 RepID=UPI0028775A36|nr:keratin-associated protein 5-5 isoform X1 [Alligator mississippiensis]
MTALPPAPTRPPDPPLPLPLPALVLLAVAAYLLGLLLLLALRQGLLARGGCAERCGCEGAGLGAPPACCAAPLPSPFACLDACCPRPHGWELGPCPPLPRCCPLCDCACACQPPDCQSVNCICFEVKLR